MSLTDSYKSRDLEPGVILTKFLIFGRFQPPDSYKKNSYKKKAVYSQPSRPPKMEIFMDVNYIRKKLHLRCSTWF